MRKAFIFISLLLISLSLAHAQSDSVTVAQGKVIPMGESLLQPLQQRDSVLIADQVFYGFELKGVKAGTQLALPVIGDTLMTGVEVVKPWQMDTLNLGRKKKAEKDMLDIRAGLTITSFDEAIYVLPPLAVLRVSEDGVQDTLVFDPQRLEVKTMPIDTTTFKPHDIKAQIKYPMTFKEVFPWVAGGLVLAGLIALLIWLIIRWKRSRNPEYIKKEPAHILALRKLDKYRGNKLWAPEKQKEFYTGITDALREYIAARYEISAMEMTTAEIMAHIKKEEIYADLMEQLKELFERADFVKFAKFVASDEDNASALPVAVRFVTSTYQSEVEEEINEEVKEEVEEEKEEVNNVL